jgi:hypothetical protein
MKRAVMMVLLTSLMVGFAAIASAQTATPRIDAREMRQQFRIREGVRSGDLTRGEAVRLRAGEWRIHRMEYRAKADGRVGAWERHRLNRALNHESRKIYGFRHNGRVRSC